MKIEIKDQTVKDVKKIARYFAEFSIEKAFDDKDKDILALRINTALQDNIRNNRDVNHEQFVPLSPLTYNRKKPPRGGRSAKPFLDTGRLLGGMEYEVKDGVIILKNNVPYVVYHQDGTDHIPQRQIYPEERLPQYLSDLINKFIEKRLDINLKDFFKS